MKICRRVVFWGSVILLVLMSLIAFPKSNIVNALSEPSVNIGLVNVTPVCLDRSELPSEELHWLYMPDKPAKLATSEYYSYLSGQLIQTGAVNASDCPLNGLWPNGYANACGLERTRVASLYLQNVYDDEILIAGRGIGVPPVMIKQLIRYESQFWPGQAGIYHFGLGHLTYLGAHNALTWSRGLLWDTYASLSQTTQTSLAEQMQTPYTLLPAKTQNILANQLLSMMSVTCPECQYKINVQKAEQSITYIAEVLLAYCKQTSQIVYNVTKKDPSTVVDYATVWKLTLFNYNVGPLCVQEAIIKGYPAVNVKAGEKLTWYQAVSNLETNSCSRGILYVENITGKYYDFGTSP